MAAFARRTWALAEFTMREALRRKFVWALVFLSAILAGVLALSPGLDPGTTLQVVQSWTFRTGALFLSILAVVVAGFHLPREIEGRQIVVLASKPVPRPAVVLGRFLGYAGMLAISVLVMGFFSALLIRTTQFLVSSRGTPVRLEVSPLVRPAGFIPVRSSVSGRQDPPDRYRLDGPAQLFRFRFSGLDAGRFPMAVPARLRFVVSNKTDPFDVSGKISVRVVRPDTGAGRDIELDGVLSGEWWPFAFPRTYLGSGEVDIEIRPGDGATQIEISRRSFDAGRQGVQLFEEPEWFEWSLLKGFGMIWLQGLLLLSVALAFSTIVSGPVAAFVGISLFLIASSHGYLRESVEDIDYVIRAAEEGHGHAGIELPAWLLRAAGGISEAVLAVVPDIGRLDATKYLLENLAVPGRLVGSAAIDVGLPVLAVLGLGILAFQLRSLA